MTPLRARAIVGPKSESEREVEEHMISQELLDILVCPACKKRVELSEGMLVCGECGRRYPIRDGIPIMLIEEGDKALQEKPPRPEG